jgi:hypothetical protein
MRLFDNPDLAWCALDDTLVFLDIARDRYFSLPEPENSAALAFLEQHRLGRRHQPAAYPQPSDFPVPNGPSPSIESGPFKLADVARTIWVQRRVENWIASRQFKAVIDDVRALIEKRSHLRSVSGRSPASTIRAFEYAKLLRSAVDRCLPRSIALALSVSSEGMRAHVVLGVKLAPFGAHCWVQAGDEVLNDSVEEVLRYQPIFII